MSRSSQTLNYAQFVEIFAMMKTATAIHVGEDAVIEAANDAMLAIWGKNKTVIGKTLEEALPELKGQPFITLFKRVWREGLTVSGVDTPADLNINGSVQTFYFDFEYRAVKDENGKMLCILHSAVDVTERFLKNEILAAAVEKEAMLQREQLLNEELAASLEELEAVNEELIQSQESLNQMNEQLELRIDSRTRALSESETRFRTMVEKSPVPMLVTTGANMRFDIINQPMLHLIAKDISVIGKSWDEAMPELIGQGIMEELFNTFSTGREWLGKEVPIAIRKSAGPVQGFYNISYKPLIEDGKTIAVLQSAIDVTEIVIARQELEKVNRELAASNEELLASNEKLASVNVQLSFINEKLVTTQHSLEDMVSGLAESETRFRSLVAQAPIAITLLQTRHLLIDVVNQKMLDTWGKTKAIIGMPLAEAMPELEGQPFLKILDDVLTSGIPFYGYESKAHIIREGKKVEGFFNFICQPIKDNTGKINSVLQVVTDVTEQVTARLKVQEAEEMMRMAVEAARLGSWTIDPVTRALRYNDTLARIFGYEGTEPMTYEQAIAQVTDDYRYKIIKEIDEAITSGGNYNFTYAQRKFNDGELIWLRSTGKISTDETGSFKSFSGVVMDVTEEKRNEIRKNDFIGMVSHELKTPLTSLNSYLQVLQAKARSAEDKLTMGALDQSVKQVKRMTTMINGFLNVSRLESGKIHIDKSVFDLADLVQEIEEEAILLYSSHTIIFHTPEQILVNADRDKIGQVINNLVSNAVKYSGAGTTIQVACTTFNGMAEVQVSDHGLGISQADLRHLFERYYRVQNNNTIAGFGIGLYLCAEIIERHQGKIWVQSEPGVGSTFFFTLAIEKDRHQ